MLIGRTQRTYFLGLILAVALACGVAAERSEAAPSRGLTVLADAQPPSVPQGMRFSGKTRKTISLVWRAASDDTAVVGYRLFRNGARVATVKTLRYVFRGLRCGRRYTIALQAYDAAGNASNRAEATGSIKTNACAATTAKKPPKKPVKKKPAAAPAGPPPGTAHLWVDTNGGSCARRASPAAYSDGQACSWNGAYQAAQTGDFVGVRGGNYGDVKIGPNKGSIAAPGVTFRTAAGEAVVVKDFENGAISGGGGASNVRFIGPARARTFRTDRTDNVVIDNWNVDCGGCVGEQIFHLEENNNVVVRNSEIQNNTNNSLMWINGSNLTFENNEIHGAHLRSGSGAHTECMYAWEVTRLTLKRNHFYDCAIMDVFITGGAVSNGGYVENNVFEKPSTGGLAFHFRNGGNPSPDPNDWDFRYNTFAGPLSISGENPVGSGGMRVIGNAFLDAETPCGAPNSTFSYNAFVSRPCGSNSMTHPLSVYQAGLSNLFGLLAASVLRDKGNPSSFPSIDRSGKKRPAGGAPDIGAYEFG
jgi:Right handed beta helix region/Fibronectin type III domain